MSHFCYFFSEEINSVGSSSCLGEVHCYDWRSKKKEKHGEFWRFKIPCRGPGYVPTIITDLNIRNDFSFVIVMHTLYALVMVAKGALFINRRFKTLQVLFRFSRRIIGIPC